MNASYLYKSLLMLLVLVVSFASFAEQKKTLGSWDVHYIAVNTTFLTPQVAKAYGVVRSNNSAFINISVLDRRTKVAQEVSVSGTARNLLGRQKTLEFKQIQDGEAIYYLAVLAFDDEERYRFDIKINQGNNNQSLKFEQKLYKE